MLTNVHKDPIPDALQVIFIHGLGGDAQTTWMHDAKDEASFWPRWIGKDVGCNVWVAGYSSAPSGWTDCELTAA
jgi:hypothetical protein